MPSACDFSSVLPWSSFVRFPFYPPPFCVPVFQCLALFLLMPDVVFLVHCTAEPAPSTTADAKNLKLAPIGTYSGCSFVGKCCCAFSSFPFSFCTSALFWCCKSRRHTHSPRIHTHRLVPCVTPLLFQRLMLDCCVIRRFEWGCWHVDSGASSEVGCGRGRYQAETR